MKKRRVALVLAGGGAGAWPISGPSKSWRVRDSRSAPWPGPRWGRWSGACMPRGILEPFKEWMRALDKYKVFSLVDFALSTEGLVKGDRVMEAMKELVPDVQIERMPCPLRRRGGRPADGRRSGAFDSGGLYDAIRASISIPSVFRPVHRDGRVLVDGGTVNPLPLNRVRREEGDLLVAVDVSARFPEPIPSAGPMRR